MLEIKGKVNTAICYAKVIDEGAIDQIQRMCDYNLTEGCKVRIMPDVHQGKGCTIGTTMTVKDKVCPNIVGVDIGIVNQVADDVAEVRTVCREGKSGRLDVRRDMHGLLRLQFMLLDKRFENAFHGQRFRMQAEGLAAFHAHGEYLLDKSAEPLQLLLADAQILVALCLFFRLVKVQQGIVGGIGYGDRGFQLMGDIVGEITFHLFQCLLPQDGADEYPE